MLLELRDALAHAAERQAVRGEDDRSRRREAHQVPLAPEEQTAADRPVGSTWFTLILVEIRGSSMSPEISTPSCVAVERGVLGRVAVAHDHAPGAAADRERVAFHHAAVHDREIGHRTTYTDCRGFTQRRQALAGEAVPLEMGGRARRSNTRRPRRARRGPSGSRPATSRAARRTERSASPHCRRGPDADGSRRRGSRARPPKKPSKMRCQSPRVVVGREAAIDDRQAIAVLEEPEIDVIERERQRHAQPMDAGRNFARLAGRRGRAMGIVEDLFGRHESMG